MYLLFLDAVASGQVVTQVGAKAAFFIPVVGPIIAGTLAATSQVLSMVSFCN
jgi:hypothetical protein